MLFGDFRSDSDEILSKFRKYFRKCFSEFFEFSSENSFPQTPKSTAKARASTVANCAAPAKTLRRVQLNSPNGLAYHLFTHMLYVPMLWTPARYRLQNIENCVLTVVRRFE